MRTTCPTCETAYTIPDERIGAKGRKVRCTKCGDEWRVTAATEAPPVAETAPLVDTAPPPAPQAVAAPPPVDPFDALETDEAVETFGTARQAVADEEPPRAAVEEPRVAPPPAADEDLPPTQPTLPLGRRINIRTKSHFPHLGRKALAAAAAKAAPFVGPAVLLAAGLVVTGVFVFRQAIVAAAPDLAGLYAALGAPVNLRGLVFGRIETTREVDNGQPVLVVEGSISNVTPQMRQVPALRFALRGVDTQELYAWSIDPRSTSIDSGDTIRFRTRLAAPPDQATDVQVRFVERRSKQAGLP